jgi:hypothetical protein
MRRHLITLCLGAWSALAGCQASPPPHAATSAPARIKESFELATEIGADGTRESGVSVRLRKTSFDKEFVLDAVRADSRHASAFHSLPSRVVSFGRRGAYVVLDDVTDVARPTRVARFPLARETERDVSFDFAEGMASDPSIAMPQGTVEEAKLSRRNELVLRVAAPAGVVTYFIGPYRPSADFVPTAASTGGPFGYLPAGQGRSAKQNLAHPITFALSARTPPEMKTAIREGIEYWNRILSPSSLPPLLWVVDAAEGVHAPDADHNVIEWVPESETRTSYADLTTDPRTGEIRRAQIFLPSSFLESHRRSALAALGEPSSLGAQSAFCAIDPGMPLPAGSVAAASSPLGEDARQARATQAARDVVRWVVAHEVGHALGLKHNFAGSTAAPYGLEARSGLYDRYLETGVAPAEAAPTSSVMDYPDPVDRLLTGSLVASRSFQYDAQAIGALYRGQVHAAEDVPLTCDEALLDVALDCQRFDAGASPVADAAEYERAAWADLPARVAAMLARGETPDPAALLKEIFARRSVLRRAAGPRPRMLRAEMDPASELARLGGLEQLLSGPAEDYAERAREETVGQLLSGGAEGAPARARDFYEALSADLKRMPVSSR